MINSRSENKELLNIATIFGATATGKTNFVDALLFMKTCVLSGFKDKYKNSYPKMESNCESLPSFFEVDIKIGKECYRYGFETILSEQKFISEWLIKLGSTEEEIFKRDILNSLCETGDYFYSFDDRITTRLKTYMNDIKDDTSILFLTVMNRNKTRFFDKNSKAKPLQQVYNWFSDTLMVSSHNDSSAAQKYVVMEEDVKKICEAMSNLGIGITGYKIEDVLYSYVVEDVIKHLKQELRESLMNCPDMRFVLNVKDSFYMFRLRCDGSIWCETVCFRHGKWGPYLNFSEESSKTIQIFNLMCNLLSSSKVYVVDDFDECLSSHYTNDFVTLLVNIVEKQDVQLILTTHDLHLTSTDMLYGDSNKTLRKDSTGNSYFL